MTHHKYPRVNQPATFSATYSPTSSHSESLANGPMKSSSLYLLTIPLLSLPLLIFFDFLLRLPHHTTPDCPHILLITQARHGSTWLLDSIEHCRYSKLEQVEPGIYGKRVYLDTEVWHTHNTPLCNITIPDVVSHLHNNSLKLFPTGVENIPRIERLLRVVDSPVVVLRRTPRDACCSLQKAQHSGQWARVKGQAPHVDDAACQCDRTCQRVCREWSVETDNYFADVARLLRRTSVQADWIWYERVKDLPVITLRHARCVVRNCNFPYR